MAVLELPLTPGDEWTAEDLPLLQAAREGSIDDEEDLGH
jgi:hypothetical protein